jgi:hypothetical protein
MEQPECKWSTAHRPLTCCTPHPGPHKPQSATCNMQKKKKKNVHPNTQRSNADPSHRNKTTRDWETMLPRNARLQHDQKAVSTPRQSSPTVQCDTGHVSLSTSEIPCRPAEAHRVERQCPRLQGRTFVGATHLVSIHHLTVCVCHKSEKQYLMR